MHFLFLGLLLGLGVAIPFGPVNLEMTRRNLHFGTVYGIALGFGASAADLTYLILLCTGTLVFLQDPLLLKIIGIAGSAILIWFGIKALRAPVINYSNGKKIKNPTLLSTLINGYLMALLSPFNILFWASVSSQISMTTRTYSPHTIYAGTGVMIGTVLWVFFLNLTLHHTRHKLSPKAVHWLNIAGGIILLIFAILGICHALFV